MTFDLPSQLILAQINNLYQSGGTYGLYDLVYDQLKKDGFEVKYDKSTTNEIWQKAKIKFAKENKRLIADWQDDKKKQHLNKYMKSMIVAKWLLERVESEGCIILSDENTGKQIKFINIVGYKS